MSLILRQLSHYSVAVVVAVAYRITHEYFDPFASLSSAAKVATYQVFAGIAGAVLGLGVVSFSVLFAVSPASRLAAIVAYGRVLRVNLTGAFIALSVALVGFGVLVPLDAGRSATAWRFVAAGLVVITITALAKLVYLADRIFRTMAKQLESDIKARDRGSGFKIVEPTNDPSGTRSIGERR
jgi:uncharacterized membrane protein